MKRKIIIGSAILLIVYPALVLGSASEPGKANSDTAQNINLDAHWVKENQALLPLIKEEKGQEALKKAKAMLRYLKKKKLLDGQEAATTYNNLGMIFLSEGEFDQAQVYLLKALQLRTKLFGNKSLEVATVWLNLSQLYKLQAQYIFKLHQNENEKKKE